MKLGKIFGIFTKIFEILKGIFIRAFETGKDLFISGVRGTETVREVAEAEKELWEYTAIYVNPPYIQTIPCSIDKTTRFVKPKLMDRVWILDKAYEGMDGKKYVILYDSYPKSIDVSRWNSPQGRDWTIDTYQVLSSKLFDFTRQIPNRERALLLVFGFLIGIAFFGLIFNFFIFKIL